MPQITEFDREIPGQKIVAWTLWEARQLPGFGSVTFLRTVQTLANSYLQVTKVVSAKLFVVLMLGLL